MGKLRALLAATRRPAVVWVGETWGAHGYGQDVTGVYATREAAWRALRPLVDTLYAADDGSLRGRPRDGEQPFGTWAAARPYRVGRLRWRHV